MKLLNPSAASVKITDIEASVVIPTRSRPRILKRSLECFKEQDFSSEEFEIIVVDDGGNKETERIIKEVSKNSAFKIKYLVQPHQGQGIARNLGVKNAQGNIIIFIGDDIFVTPDFIKEHVKIHKEYPYENEACLGLILWHPELKVTPLMRFMTTGGAIFGKFGGHQFAYDILKNKSEANFWFFYTSNISLKRKLLLDHPFDPWFSSYGWEDIELGYRLAKHTHLRIFYNPQALAYHFHPISRKDFENRMREIGKSALILHKKYPELKTAPDLKKKIIFNLLSNSFSLKILDFISRSSHEKLRYLYYYALSKHHFLRGLKDATL